MEERVAKAGVLDVAHLHRLKPRKLFWAGSSSTWPCNSKEMILMAIAIKDLEKWIGEAIKDDHNFETKSLDPEAQKAKEMIRKVIRKLKGRVD